MHWSYSKGGNWTLCTLVTFGGHVALPIETWSSCAHGHMMMGTREEGTFTGRRDFSISDWWNRNPASRMLLNPALDFVGLFFSVVFLSNIKVEGWRKKTTGLSIFICETKPETSVDSQLTLERPDDAFFSCLRQIIFCKFTVTSVLFSVYYIDSKLTLKCNGGVPDHCIFTVCVCFYWQVWMCVCVRWCYMNDKGKWEQVTNCIYASSVFLMLTLFLTQRSECVLKPS